MSTLNPVLSPEAQSSSDDDLDLKLNSTMVSEANDVLPQGKMATISEPYTEKESELFQNQYENGYDLLHDDRYKRCTQMWQLSPNPQKQLTTVEPL